MAKRKPDAATLDLSAAATVGPVDVSNSRQFTVHLVGITGGGSVTVQYSPDGGTTWIAEGAARTADTGASPINVTALWDMVRIVVGTGKASAFAVVRRLQETAS